MSSRSIPPAWVERIFERFVAAFGSMKVGAMWPADQHDAVKEVWAAQLGRFAPETIRNALQAVIDSGREWPPTLPEFVEHCRQCAMGRAQAAEVPLLTNGVSHRDEEVSRAVKQAIERGQTGQLDPRHWAKHPKSAQAVKLLVRGCEREPSLRPILLQLLRDPSPCRSGEARMELDAVREYLPAWARQAA